MIVQRSGVDAQICCPHTGPVTATWESTGTVCRQNVYLLTIVIFVHVFIDNVNLYHFKSLNDFVASNRNVL